MEGVVLDFGSVEQPLQLTAGSWQISPQDSPLDGQLPQAAESGAKPRNDFQDLLYGAPGGNSGPRTPRRRGTHSVINTRDVLERSRQTAEASPRRSARRALFHRLQTELVSSVSTPGSGRREAHDFFERRHSVIGQQTHSGQPSYRLRGRTVRATLSAPAHRGLDAATSALPGLDGRPVRSARVRDSLREFTEDTSARGSLGDAALPGRSQSEHQLPVRERKSLQGRASLLIRQVRMNAAFMRKSSKGAAPLSDLLSLAETRNPSPVSSLSSVPSEEAELQGLAQLCPPAAPAPHGALGQRPQSSPGAGRANAKLREYLLLGLPQAPLSRAAAARDAEQQPAADAQGGPACPSTAAAAAQRAQKIAALSAIACRLAGKPAPPVRPQRCPTPSRPFQLGALLTSGSAADSASPQTTPASPRLHTNALATAIRVFSPRARPASAAPPAAAPPAAAQPQPSPSEGASAESGGGTPQNSAKRPKRPLWPPPRPLRRPDGSWHYFNRHKLEIEQLGTMVREWSGEDAARAFEERRRRRDAALEAAAQRRKHGQLKKHDDRAEHREQKSTEAEERLQAMQNREDTERRCAAWQTVVITSLYPTLLYRRNRIWLDDLDFFCCARAMKTMIRLVIPALRRMRRRRLRRLMASTMFVGVACARIRRRRLHAHADRVLRLLRAVTTDGRIAVKRFAALVRKAQRMARTWVVIRNAQLLLLERWFVKVETQMLLRSPEAAVDPSDKCALTTVQQCAQAFVARARRIGWRLPTEMQRAVQPRPYRNMLPPPVLPEPPEVSQRLKRRPIEDYIRAEAAVAEARRRWKLVRDYVFGGMRNTRMHTVAKAAVASAKRQQLQQQRERKIIRRLVQPRWRRPAPRTGPDRSPGSSTLGTPLLPRRPPSRPIGTPGFTNEEVLTGRQETVTSLDDMTCTGADAARCAPPGLQVVRAAARLKVQGAKAERRRELAAAERGGLDQNRDILPARLSVLRTHPEVRRQACRELLFGKVETFRRRFGKVRLDYWLELREREGDAAGRLPWEREDLAGGETQWREILLKNPPPRAPRMRLLRTITDREIEGLVKRCLRGSMLRRVLASGGFEAGVFGAARAPDDDVLNPPSASSSDTEQRQLSAFARSATQSSWKRQRPAPPRRPISNPHVPAWRRESSLHGDTMAMRYGDLDEESRRQRLLRAQAACFRQRAKRFATISERNKGK